MTVTARWFNSNFLTSATSLPCLGLFSDLASGQEDVLATAIPTPTGTAPGAGNGMLDATTGRWRVTNVANSRLLILRSICLYVSSGVNLILDNVGMDVGALAVGGESGKLAKLTQTNSHIRIFYDFLAADVFVGQTGFLYNFSQWEYSDSSILVATNDATNSRFDLGAPGRTLTATIDAVTEAVSVSNPGATGGNNGSRSILANYSQITGDEMTVNAPRITCNSHLFGNFSQARNLTLNVSNINLGVGEANFFTPASLIASSNINVGGGQLQLADPGEQNCPVRGGYTGSALLQFEPRDTICGGYDFEFTNPSWPGNATNAQNGLGFGVNNQRLSVSGKVDMFYSERPHFLDIELNDVSEGVRIWAFLNRIAPQAGDRWLDNKLICNTLIGTGNVISYTYPNPDNHQEFLPVGGRQSILSERTVDRIWAPCMFINHNTTDRTTRGSSGIRLIAFEYPFTTIDTVVTMGPREPNKETDYELVVEPGITEMNAVNVSLYTALNTIARIRDYSYWESLGRVPGVLNTEAAVDLQISLIGFAYSEENGLPVLDYGSLNIVLHSRTFTTAQIGNIVTSSTATIATGGTLTGTGTLRTTGTITTSGSVNIANTITLDDASSPRFIIENIEAGTRVSVYNGTLASPPSTQSIASSTASTRIHTTTADGIFNATTITGLGSTINNIIVVISSPSRELRVQRFTNLSTSGGAVIDAALVADPNYDATVTATGTRVPSVQTVSATAGGRMIVRVGGDNTLNSAQSLKAILDLKGTQTYNDIIATNGLREDFLTALTSTRAQIDLRYIVFDTLICHQYFTGVGELQASSQNIFSVVRSGSLTVSPNPAETINVFVDNRESTDMVSDEEFQESQAQLRLDITNVVIATSD